MEEDTLLQDLEQVYGLNDDVETVLNYARYVDLRLAGEIKDIGNYNIIIKCPVDYPSTTTLIDIITNILTSRGIVTDVNYCDFRQLSFRYSKCYDRELVILDKGMDFGIKGMQEKLKQYIHSRTNKVFILLLYSDDEDTHIFQESLLDEFAWYVKIEDLSKVERQDYIKHKLKRNHISVSKKCKFISKLAEYNSIVIDDELLDIVIKCKTNGIKTITESFLKDIGKTSLLSSPTADIQDTKLAMDELDALIGLEDIKMQIKQIINYVKVSKMKGQTPMLTFCFSGNSGTGKTEVARLVGKLFAEEGLLSSDKFIEVSRNDLIAGFVGQTAMKTQAVINKAIGGTLLIDEAYSLDPKDSSKDYGHECISTLIKAMEDNRDNLCVILTGYTKDMESLLESNAGFKSRISFYLHFPDYTAEELYLIFKKMANDRNYKLASNVKDTLLEHFEKAQKQENFGNARYVRNLLEKIEMELAQRVISDGTDNCIIKLCDVKAVIERLEKQHPKKKQKIGFR